MAMDWHTSDGTLSIAILAGGDSHERAVSLASGAEVTRALQGRGHRVASFDPAKIDLSSIRWDDYQVCFIALHGGAGEDGRVAAQLERLNVPYTGSGPAASRLAMSKSASKERFVQAGVPTLPYILFHESDAPAQIEACAARLGFPLVVKPDSQGSSLGVGFAQRREELATCIAESFEFDAFALAEPWVDGREYTVAVLERRPLPVLEIGTPRGFFDYEAKYHAGTTEYRFDTGLDSQQTVMLETTAVAAAAALSTSGLVRVDIMVDGLGQPWVLEVNTIPGLTRTSLAPKAAAEGGLDFPSLCEWMIQDALRVEVAR
jgi:D-alanine-D-alanine ligase